MTAIGQRSVNNIVDVTNYILFLFGQPLHAFDLDKLKNADGRAHIVVRAAQDGEPLTTLDGEKRTLTSDMTVISTPEQGAVALAGVMGGLDTEVTDDTVNILLEAATFERGPHQPHQPQPRAYQRKLHALRARRGRPRHRGAFRRRGRRSSRRLPAAP